MRTRIRKMGNSQGVIIPKPLLAQAGLENEAEMVVEKTPSLAWLTAPHSAQRGGPAVARRTCHVARS
jgi:antitoxin MazE